MTDFVIHAIVFALGSFRLAGIPLLGYYLKLPVPLLDPPVS
jgi:hypothetical protein